MYSSLVNMLNLTSSNECTCIQAYMWACSFVPMAGARACHAHVRKNEREEGRMKKKKWCHKHRMWKPFPVRFFFSASHFCGSVSTILNHWSSTLSREEHRNCPSLHSLSLSQVQDLFAFICMFSWALSWCILKSCVLRLRGSMSRFLMFGPVRAPSGVTWAPHRYSVKSPAVQVHGAEGKS